MKTVIRSRILQELILIFIAVMLVVGAVILPKMRPKLHREMFQTDRITIYADHCYGRVKEDPLVLTDPEEVQEIVEKAQQLEQYRRVDGQELEASGEQRNEIWVDFHTGYRIGMSVGEKYGNVGKEMGTTGPGPSYELPEEFRHTVKQTLEKHIGNL